MARSLLSFKIHGGVRLNRPWRRHSATSTGARNNLSISVLSPCGRGKIFWVNPKTGEMVPASGFADWNRPVWLEFRYLSTCWYTWDICCRICSILLHSTFNQFTILGAC